jgi:hypothetical protein
MRAQGGWFEFTGIGYAAVSVRTLGETQVIVAAPGFDGWQNIVYPDPPDPALRQGGPLFTSRQVVDTEGRLLYQELWPASGVAWQQSLQYDTHGELEFVNIGGILPYASTAIDIPDGQPPLALYSSSPAQVAARGSLRVLTEAGVEVARIEWPAGLARWQPLGSLALGPGTYTLRFDDDRHDWHHFVLLAEDVSLPPGTR